ncbi:MAG: hypothetical protein ACR2MD_02025 [Aridibacter sp.]|jgi:hypothetical protein|nr:hypothetical protein [Acidobacteriota bacterium]
MQNDLSKVVAEKVAVLPIEKQQKVLDFVESIEEKEPQKKSLFEKLAEIRERVPEEVWDKIPTDGAENHDHYLYGASKKKQ